MASFNAEPQRELQKPDITRSGPVMLIMRDVGRAAARNHWIPASSGVNAAFGSLVFRPTGGGSLDPAALNAIERRGRGLVVVGGVRGGAVTF